MLGYGYMMSGTFLCFLGGVLVWPGISVSHETRESGIAEGCRWYSCTSANRFGVVRALMRLCGGLCGDTGPEFGDVGPMLPAAVLSSELSTPGPSGRTSCMLSRTFQVGCRIRFSGSWSGGGSGSGSGVLVALTSSDTTS